MKNTLSTMNSYLLDIVRIIAAWAVLLGHCFGKFQLTIFKNENYFPYIQSLGVVILFILSGFLAAYSLEKKQNDESYTFKNYFCNRFYRYESNLIPALFVILLIDFIGIKLYGDIGGDICDYNIINFCGNILMLQEVPIISHYINVFGSGRPLWTLSIEWWLSLCYGHLFFIFRKMNKVSIRTIILLVLFSLTPLQFLVTNGVTLCFIFGVFIFYIYPKVKIKHINLMLCFSILICIVTMMITKKAYNIAVFITFGVLFLFLMSFGRDKEHKKSKFVSVLSRYTFMLYLVHYSILIYVDNLDIFQWNKLIVTVIFSNIIAMLIWRISEVENKITYTILSKEYLC